MKSVRLASAALLCVGWLMMLAPPTRAQQLREVFRRVNSSVVVVYTLQKPSLATTVPDDETNAGGLGSGVLVSNDGKVLTAAHVVQTADAIEVEFLNGQRIGARVLTSVPFADIALLQLERMPDQPVIARLGDSDKAEIGEEIFVIGAPFGMNHSLSVGHISARHRQPNVYEGLTALEVLQTDAAIYNGNSGGPMFNFNGEVIGIVSHVLTRGANVSGLGMAVASNVARRLMLEQQPFWTGIEAFLLEGRNAEIFNVPQPAGLLVQSIADGSPAERLGLRESTLPVTLDKQPMLAGGDIILEMAGLPVGTGASAIMAIQQQLNKLKPGDIVTVKILRAGKIVELSTPVTGK